MFWRRRRQPAEPDAGFDLSGLAVRWRPRVEEAVGARERFRGLVAQVREGPVQDRLDGLAGQVDAAVEACWRTAARATQLESTVAALDPATITDQLKAARRRLDARPDDPLLQAEEASLSAQHRSAHRLWNELDGCDQRLRLLDLRLDEAVARAAELVLGRGVAAQAAVETAEGELQRVVDDLDALQVALDEVQLDASGPR